MTGSDKNLIIAIAREEVQMLFISYYLLTYSRFWLIVTPSHHEACHDHSNTFTRYSPGRSDSY